MIKIYTSPSCSSCRKVKKWFEDHKIEYVEKSIFSASLNEKDIYEILEKSENGTEDIIATKSKIMKENKVNFDDMSISEMINFVRKNPSVLKRPIVIDDEHDRIQVGYNEDDIRLFIPKARRYLNEICLTDDCKKLNK